MAGHHCIPTDFAPEKCSLAVEEKYSPISFPLYRPSGRPVNTASSPGLHTERSTVAWCNRKKRQEFDHLCGLIANSGLTGADLAIEYLCEKYRKNLSIATIKQASYVLLSFLYFLREAGFNLYELTHQEIGAFVEREQGRGLKIKSVVSNLRNVYTFLHFLIENKALPQAVMSKKIHVKLPELLPRAIPPEHVATILSVIDDIRNRALIMLLLRTGLRIGELLNVKVSDIILSERKILIHLAEKNDQGRVVYFGSDAANALQQWLAIRNIQKEYLFYSPTAERLGYAAARKIMVKVLEKAGLSQRGYSLHSLRHTFATEMLNAGLRLEVLQQILGHQSIEITLRYARLSDTTRENEYFRAMTVIERGEYHESHRINSQLQKVFEEKKLLTSHHKKLSA